MTGPILVTGAAGFIGFHLSRRWLRQGFPVVGIDNLNDSYTVALKQDRVRQLQQLKGFRFHQLDIEQADALEPLFTRYTFTHVVHLAAQTGVRSSTKNPQAHINANLLGFSNVLETCRRYDINHLVFASSSSVYGNNGPLPSLETANTDRPLSVYAASKKSGEVMAHAYAHLYNLPVTVVRLFTVYGPWGRPNMAYFLFTKAILEGTPIKVFNQGKMKRDFTYIEDVVDGLSRLLETWKKRLQPKEKTPYQAYNLGSSQPVELMKFIEQLERLLGRTAKKQFLEQQPGEATATHASIKTLQTATDFTPQVSLKEGLRRFVDWYRAYYSC